MLERADERRDEHDEEGGAIKAIQKMFDRKRAAEAGAHQSESDVGATQEDEFVKPLEMTKEVPPIQNTRGYTKSTRVRVDERKKVQWREKG